MRSRSFDHHLGYMGPLTLYLYFKYGRAKKHGKVNESKHEEPKHMHHASSETSPHPPHHDIEKQSGEHDAHTNGHHSDHANHAEHQTAKMHAHHDPIAPHDEAHENMHDIHNMAGHEEGHMMHDMMGDRPMWAVVFIGVSHCGAGCVLGDIVGEWLVYGTGVMINGHDIWPALLIDYGFALLFGIVFQYFSIAPMSGEYGLKTIVRAVKADILSLTAFEVGLFGWMIAYQVGIWGYKLEMNTWTVRMRY